MTPNRGRVFLVGHERAGKTTLLSALFGGGGAGYRERCDLESGRIMLGLSYPLSDRCPCCFFATSGAGSLNLLRVNRRMLHKHRNPSSQKTH